MRFEIPELGRCCFCFPLRLGLLVWGYIKLIANLALLIFMLVLLYMSYEERFWNRTNLPYLIIYIIVLGSIIADIVFHIIFAIGAHKKDPKKIELFSRFCIYILVLYVAGLITSFVYSSYDPHFLILCLGFTLGTIFFACILSQIYIIILVRSEVKKLERSSNFEFVNHVAESNLNVKLGIDA